MYTVHTCYYYRSTILSTYYYCYYNNKYSYIYIICVSVLKTCLPTTTAYNNNILLVFYIIRPHIIYKYIYLKYYSIIYI